MTTRLEKWMVKHTGALLAVLALTAVCLIGVTAVVLVKERGVEQKIGPGVESVGPCRSAVSRMGLPAGLFDKECVRQSNYVIWSYCLRHPRAKCPGLPADLRASKSSQVSETHTPHSGSRGGGKSNGASASSPSGPPSSGPSTSSPPSNPPSGGGPPPSNPPPSNPVNDVIDGVRDTVDDTVDQVCHLNPLGIRICN